MKSALVSLLYLGVLGVLFGPLSASLVWETKWPMVVWAVTIGVVALVMSTVALASEYRRR